MTSMSGDWLSRLLIAALVTGVTDGLFSSALAALAYGSTVTRLWQGVASTLLGASAFEGGMRTAAIGVLTAAAIYGPVIWLVMSMAVVPALTHRSPAINLRWWVQFFGHIPFVALPIAGLLAPR